MRENSVKCTLIVASCWNFSAKKYKFHTIIRKEQKASSKILKQY